MKMGGSWMQGGAARPDRNKSPRNPTIKAKRASKPFQKDGKTLIVNQSVSSLPKKGRCLPPKPRAMSAHLTQMTSSRARMPAPGEAIPKTNDRHPARTANSYCITFLSASRGSERSKTFLSCGSWSRGGGGQAVFFCPPPIPIPLLECIPQDNSLETHSRQDWLD